MARMEDSVFDYDYDYLFKVLIIGDKGVGKTNIRLQYTSNTVDLESEPTKCVEFGARTITVDGKKVKVQIWDIAGTQRQAQLLPPYYKKAVGVLQVYDIINGKSHSIEPWVRQIREYADTRIKGMLVGNKCDLADKRQISFEAAANWAAKLGLLFQETSAMNTSYIDNMFKTLLTQIYRKSN